LNEGKQMKTVIYEVADGVATLTLNRPAQKNALDLVMRDEIAQVVGEIIADRGIQALILTGAGGAFCAGGDIQTMGGPALSANAARDRMQDLHRWLVPLMTLDCPVIAAVDGVAYGAGFGLALTADFILASPRARFCLPFQRLGLMPDCGILYTLPRAVGMQRAKELIFSTRELTADEARQIGIVAEIQPEQQLANRAREIALAFTHASPTAIGLTKRALNASLNCDLGTVLEMEASGQGIARTTEYHQNAAARFIAKQGAEFRWPANRSITEADY
jgi:2-(1,2-epoxy-1,2-dihydrophenyl)acetyl-CoA isomerase